MIHTSYDYSELIEELESDIQEGLIDQNGSLLIVRSSDSVLIDDKYYYPIIDYYAEDFEQSIKEEIKDLQKEESWDFEGAEEHLKQAKKLLRLFNKDKDRLEKISVNAVLVEMYDYNRIVR